MRKRDIVVRRVRRVVKRVERAMLPKEGCSARWIERWRGSVG